MTYDRSEDFDLTRPKNVAPMVKLSKLSSISRSYVSLLSFFTSPFLLFDKKIFELDFLPLFFFFDIFEIFDSESFSPKSCTGLATVMDFEVVDVEVEPPRGKSWDDILFVG